MTIHPFASNPSSIVTSSPMSRSPETISRPVTVTRSPRYASSPTRTLPSTEHHVSSRQSPSASMSFSTLTRSPSATLRPRSPNSTVDWLPTSTSPSVTRSCSSTVVPDGTASSSIGPPPSATHRENSLRPYKPCGVVRRSSDGRERFVVVALVPPAPSSVRPVAEPSRCHYPLRPALKGYTWDLDRTTRASRKTRT